MSRKLVIFICCLNVLLGAGVLWFVLKPSKVDIPYALQPSTESNTSAYSDAELWTKAEEASTTREAYGYLQQITFNSDTFNQAAKQIDQLIESSAPPFKNWPYFEALIQFHGNRSKSLDDLQPLAKLTLKQEQALTLRNQAFRSYIENLSKLDADISNQAYALIDKLLDENNSLSGTAMQAEQYLREKDIRRSEGGADEDRLASHAEAVLLDSSAPTSNRLTAANTLFRLGIFPDSNEIQRTFAGTDSERLAVALLQLLAASNPADGALDWVEGVHPTTPEQEQLIRSILER